MKMVYLAGAIDKVSPDFALSWRKAAKERLIAAGYQVLDPTDDKNLFSGTANTTDFTPADIVETDLNMIDRADIVLAEISRTDIPYHGTSMELVYAMQAGKLVIVWGGCRSYWVRYHADCIFGVLEDALLYLTGGRVA